MKTKKPISTLAEEVAIALEKARFQAARDALKHGTKLYCSDGKGGVRDVDPLAILQRRTQKLHNRTTQ